MAEQLGIKLHIVDIVDEYKQVVFNPHYSYGANLNPCLDCKIFMVARARDWIERNGFDLVITGEVVGQRRSRTAVRVFRPQPQTADGARSATRSERLCAAGRRMLLSNRPPLLHEIAGSVGFSW